MIRSILGAVVEGVIKRFSGAGRPDETIENREYFQHYGYTSRPLAGAEGILIQEGNHIVMVASDDRRYRIGIEAGEVCIYTDELDHIRFKRNKEIFIKSGNKLTAEIENDIVATTKRIDVHASESALLRAPLVTIKADQFMIERYTDGLNPQGTWKGNLRVEGDVTVTGGYAGGGNITATGTILDTIGNTNHHVH